MPFLAIRRAPDQPKAVEMIATAIDAIVSGYE
jgi:hypothetical protein